MMPLRIHPTVNKHATAIVTKPILRRSGLKNPFMSLPVDGIERLCYGSSSNLQ
jgi:hypothetical protein